MARWVSQAAVCSASGSALGRVRYLAELFGEVDELITAYFETRPRGETVTPHVLTSIGRDRLSGLGQEHGRDLKAVKQDMGRLVPIRMIERFGRARVLTYREGRGGRSPSTRPVPPEFGSWINKYTPHRLVGADNNDRIILDTNVVLDIVDGSDDALDLEWLWLIKGDHPVSIADPAWAEILRRLLRSPERMHAWPEAAERLTAILDPSLPVVPSGWEVAALAGIRQPRGFDPAAAAAYYAAVWAFTASAMSPSDLSRTVRYDAPDGKSVEVGPMDPEALVREFETRRSAWWSFIERVLAADSEEADTMVHHVELDLARQGVDRDGLDRLALYVRSLAVFCEGVRSGARTAQDNDSIDLDILFTTALPAWLCTSDRRLRALARETGIAAADQVVNPAELLAELDMELVTTAVDRLRADFPTLSEALMPQFETNALAAVERRGFRVLHDEKRLSLLSLLHDLEWGNQGQIVRTFDGQVAKLRDVPRVEQVYERLAECERGVVLSTASELALACFLQDQGADIEFDHPYRLEGNDDPGDVDLLAKWSWGCVAFEVYSPVHQMTNTRSGWISLRPDGLAERVGSKVHSTFGSSDTPAHGFPEATLKIVAVDVTYNETAYLGLHLPLGKVPEEFKEVDLGGADAVLVFTHYQHQDGHPVVVHGLLTRSDLDASALWRSLQSAAETS